jgi:hypothetical protein
LQTLTVACGVDNYIAFCVREGISRWQKSEIFQQVEEGMPANNDKPRVLVIVTQDTQEVEGRL